MRFVSYRCRVEYLELPKCACTSIKAALLASDSIAETNGDEIHSHKHFWADRLPRGLKLKLTFTFVRHPVERLRSAYREKLLTGLAKRLKGNCPFPLTATFDEFAAWVTHQNKLNLDKHWRPLNLQFKRFATKPAFIGKLENIEDEWAWLQREYGLPVLPQVNASRLGGDETLSPRMLKRVLEYYRDDLVLFNYPDTL